jgi:hypothetical protein
LSVVKERLKDRARNSIRDNAPVPFNKLQRNSSFLLVHCLDLAFERGLQPFDRFREVAGRGNGKGVIGFLVVVCDNVLDLPFFRLLWFDDQLCHGDTRIVPRQALIFVAAEDKSAGL